MRNGNGSCSSVSRTNPHPFGSLPRQKGNPRDLPPPRRFPEGWTLGKPDVVVSMPRAFNVPAKGGKNGVRYQCFPVETKFAEDRWIQEAEALFLFLFLLLVVGILLKTILNK